jgi:hypothetical protein
MNIIGTNSLTDSLINCDDLALRRRAELYSHQRRDHLIREAAYFCWLHRCAPGDALGDWLEAEREIDAKLGFSGR